MLTVEQRRASAALAADLNSVGMWANKLAFEMHAGGAGEFSKSERDAALYTLFLSKSCLDTRFKELAEAYSTTVEAMREQIEIKCYGKIPQVTK